MARAHLARVYPAAHDPGRVEDESLAVHQTATIQHIYGVKSFRVRPARFGVDPPQTFFAEAFGRKLDDAVEHHGCAVGGRAVLGWPYEHALVLENRPRGSGGG